VDIEVPLRTADAVLEVLPQERVTTPAAKMSTFRGERVGGKLSEEIEELRRARARTHPKIAITRDSIVNIHRSDGDSLLNVMRTRILDLDIVIHSGDDHHHPLIYKSLHTGV
jgi:hypothetical protein